MDRRALQEPASSVLQVSLTHLNLNGLMSHALAGDGNGIFGKTQRTLTPDRHRNRTQIL